MALLLGSPPKLYFLDMDTGSDLTWAQCDAPCRNCAIVSVCILASWASTFVVDFGCSLSGCWSCVISSFFAFLSLRKLGWFILRESVQCSTCSGAAWALQS